MIYQAEISGVGEHIHIPIEADTDTQAYARACQYAEEHFPRPMRKYIKTTRLKEGEQARDDRDVLKFAPEPRMGRPSQGRTKRLQATVTPDLAQWLESQKQASESTSDAVFRLLEGVRSNEK